MSRTTSYVYQSIAQSVVDHGIDTMFGLMGDGNLFMVDHYVRHCGGTFIPVAIEGSSVMMALAYSKVAGKVGVATVTHGPALTNCITAIVEGVKARTPMVLLTGDTAIIDPQNIQNIDQNQVVSITGAGFVQIRSPQTLTQDIANAFYKAETERRPIVVNMPADWMWQEVEHQKVTYPTFMAPSMVPEGDDFDNAIGMIASARRPIILAGGGAIAAKESIIKLADRLEAPLATTLKGKGMFNDHPFNMDIFGTLSTPQAYDLIAQSDCIICFGTSLHYFTTDRGKLVKDKNVVQINNQVTEVGINYHPTVALTADAKLTAENIVYWLDEAEIPSSEFTRELTPYSLNQHPVNATNKTVEGCINYIEALEKLERALPENRVLTTDGGRFMTEVWCRISVPNPESFVTTANFGAIGLGLQGAIGAGLADTDRPVVVFSGDGGFMMGGVNEFNTAVRLNMDLIVIVCNDSAYGAEHIQFVDRAMDPGLTEFEWPSFAAVANALGGQGILVESDADLDKAIDAIKDRNKPILIELKLDPNDVPRMRV
ncbi:MAG: acetolactate synthase [Neptuniibacter caesariensis]|uniref:Acetolactate synthase n=1 Tax=Neptuniibacter caesariensis TaxID=207954 RepID=A0A2G6JD58_NEPCE|nr:MAG: acetolactate synthase [Neptuniibacter caesariensis]